MCENSDISAAIDYVEPGVCDVLREPGVCDVLGEPGLCNVLGEPGYAGVCDVQMPVQLAVDLQCSLPGVALWSNLHP